MKTQQICIAAVANARLERFHVISPQPHFPSHFDICQWGWKWFICWIGACWFVFPLALVIQSEGLLAADEIRPTFVMDSDPSLVLPEPVQAFPKRCKELWLEALARPDADLQRLAARAIAQAHVLGMSGLVDAEPTLVSVTAAEGTHRTARFAAAHALIVLNCQSAAPTLFAASQRYGGDLRLLIEPALAQWRFQPIAKIWNDRLRTRNPRHRELLLAIRGLGALGEASTVDLLDAIVRDPFQPSGTRLAAARSAGRVADSGLEANALRLLNNSTATPVDRLSALALLARHSSLDAQAVFFRLALDTEPGVTAAALERLNAIDSSLVVPLAEQAMQNDDPSVRKQGIDAYVDRPSPQRAAFLARLLDDPHPAIRSAVREHLFRLTQSPEYDASIRDAVMAMLTDASWRGQEQALLLLGALDHKPAASGMVALLESPRGEVMVAAAWGLRRLAVPKTLPAILDKAFRQTDARTRAHVGREVDLQVAHLFEAMGTLNYAPAEPLWRKYIPKDYVMGEYSRGAAIWSLGRLYAGRTDESLSRLMVERLTDSAPPPLEPPEMMRVRVMCGVSLGRMGAVSQLDRIRAYLGPIVKPIPSSLAIRWAIREMTGEILPEPEPEIVLHSDWFLVPLEDGESERR